MTATPDQAAHDDGVQDRAAQAPAVLFLHGAGVASWMWEPVLRELGGAVRPIVVDLPGHGTRTGTPWTTDTDAVRDLGAVVTAESVSAVVGFSLGAQLAMSLASTHPDRLSGAVIVSAETVPAPARRLTIAILRATAPLARRPWFARLQARQLGVPSELTTAYVRDSTRISTQTLIGTVRDNIVFTPPGAWASFPGRAVVLVGEHERRVMRSSAERTHRALVGSTLSVVSGAAHDVPFTAPAAVAQAVRSVID